MTYCSSHTYAAFFVSHIGKKVQIENRNGAVILAADIQKTGGGKEYDSQTEDVGAAEEELYQIPL